MRLHLIGLFHTQSTSAFSHCAFTGKAMRFPKMMQAQGYHVIEYSNEGSEAGATEHVPILTQQEYNQFFGDRDSATFFGDSAVVGSEPHQLFEKRLIEEIASRIEPQDIICHPFGHAHQALTELFPANQHVETGIGYPTLMPNSFRIFESYAWMHFHQGKENRNGRNYEWVVPNYYDLDDWEPNLNPGEYLAFLGRITAVKGMDTLRAIADYSKYPIVLHGQGDPTPWQHPNIIYKGPIHGKQRSEFLRNAKALLAPSNFTEPFCGMTVEAMLCGTPVISVDYGAMTETVQEGMGFRCHTLQDWLDAIDNIDSLDRSYIANVSRSKYSLEACGVKYDKIFRQLNDLHRKGWYEVSHFNYPQIEAEEKPFADNLAQWVQSNISPQKVIDVGCGPGMHVASLRNLGVEAIGCDINPHIKYNDYILQTAPSGLNEKADLVLCLEVAEHMPEPESLLFLQDTLNCVSEGGLLIWSAACPGQGGVGHVNCQPKEFWVREIESRGFQRECSLEEKMLGDIQKGVYMGWFIQNAMVFRQSLLQNKP